MIWTQNYGQILVGGIVVTPDIVYCINVQPIEA
jgi:hypothetical protein